MKIIKANLENIDKYIKIYESAMKFMRESGNPNQWTDNHHPNRDMIISHLNKDDYYEIYDEINNETIGMFVLALGIDETYLKINGSWLNDLPYVTIHMVAKKSGYKGIFKLISDFAKTKSNNVRIDTHKDNKIMQRSILNEGFKYCGIIHLNDANHSERLAYQYTK